MRPHPSPAGTERMRTDVSDRRKADLEAHLIEICETNRNCEDVVDSHFNTCSDLSHSFGTKRRGSKVKTEKLAGCLNHKAGFEYFGT